MGAFLENEVMSEFSIKMGTGGAYVFDDRNTQLALTIPDPPSQFNPDANQVWKPTPPNPEEDLLI